MNQFDVERQQIERDLAEGIITVCKYNLLMRAIDRDEREAALEMARDAYNNVMENY